MEHVADGLEVILEILPRDVPAQVAHVHGGAAAHPSAARGPWPTAGPALAVFAHEYQAALELGVVQLADRGCSVARVLERHEAAALGARRPWLQHHVGVKHWSDGLEVILEILPRDVPRQVAHVHRRAAT